MLERELKVLEEYDDFYIKPEYIEKKRQLEQIYDKFIEGARIRSKCKDYELGEKSNKYFLNLEKRRAKLSSITCVKNGSNTDVSDPYLILAELENLFVTLLKNNCKASLDQSRQFIRNLNLKSLNLHQK